MTEFPRLTWQRIALKLRNPFRLAYGTSEERTAYWIRLSGDEGWGEGTIPPYYGVSEDSMVRCWQAAAEKREPFPEDVNAVPAWVGSDGPAPARAALDLALLDRIARRQNLSIHRLLGLPRPDPKPTSFTIAIDRPETMAGMALQVANYPVLKVKLGSDALDVQRIAAIRKARPDARLRVDANAGWKLAEALRMVRDLEGFDLEMIEQPLDRHDIPGMGQVQRATSIPIVADESLQTLTDIEALSAAGVAGINLKLMKVGGLSPALVMLRRARELGLKVMLGCMIETSIGATAMAALGGVADWLDLDSPMLITNDPFQGISYDEHAMVTVPDLPGIGATLRAQ
jgi:L-alanine-DL-glutamate epimerase-like enolase superfamily enzyme